MKNRALWLLAAIAVFAVAGFASDLPSAWRAWKYSRAIDTKQANVLNYVTIDREVFAHSENRLADLRIIDDLGNELPYELRDRLSPPSQPVIFPAVLRENSFAPGQFTQIVADLGDRPNFHDRVRVQTTESDFIDWVEVAA